MKADRATYKTTRELLVEAAEETEGEKQGKRSKERFPCFLFMLTFF